METPKNSLTPDKTQLCIIKIIFPVTSDEVALGVKSGIDSIVSPIENSRLEFTIKSMYGIPPNMPLPANFSPPKVE